MKCFISYRRANADTINGEALTVSQRYSTFDKAEMDRFEDYLKSTMSCGVSVEYDIDKCIEYAKEGNDAVLQRIRDEIQKVINAERDFTSEDAKAQAIALNWCLEIIDKYKGE